MTRKGQSPMEQAVRSKIARLMQLHLDTNPNRVARRFGISVSYVRQLWRERDRPQLAPTHDALATLYAAPAREPERPIDNQFSQCAGSSYGDAA